MVALALWPLQDMNGLKPVIIPASPQRLSIGRKVTCLLAIAEEFGYVSGEHCRVSRLSGEDADTGCLLEDLSANGTYVNSSRVGKDKSIKIVIGDVISLAKPTRTGGALKFKLQEAPPAAAAPQAPTAAAAVSENEIGRASVAQPPRPLATTAHAPVIKSPASNIGSAAAANEVVPAAPVRSLGAAVTTNSEDARVCVAHVPRPLATTADAPVIKASTSTPGLAVAKEASAPSRAAVGPGEVLSAQAAAAESAAVEGHPSASSRTFAASSVGPGLRVGWTVTDTTSALAQALAAEERRGHDETGVIQARCRETEARSRELTVELREAREEVRSSTRKSAADVRVSEDIKASARSENGRLTDECAELRAQLLKAHEASARLERESLPAAGDASRLEKLHTSKLRDEMAAEKACMDQAEAQANALRHECAEAEARAHNESLQAELEAAEARNANLEEECAELCRESERSEAAIAVAHAKLSNRASTLTTLKGAVKDHVQRLMERASILDRALLDVPSGNSAAASSQPSRQSRSRSPQLPDSGGRHVSDSVTGKVGSSSRIGASVTCGQLRPPLNAEDPTIAYPDAGLELRPLEERGSASEMPGGDTILVPTPAKKRKSFSEFGAWDAEEVRRDGHVSDAPIGDRQPSQSSLSPPPTAVAGTSATAAVVQAAARGSQLGGMAAISCLEMGSS